MKIIAGHWRGRRLVAPPGRVTRPTSERLRQALFDMLAHAPWAGQGLLEGALVLDLFAGTGALGLEALSRGAARAEFFEQDKPALAALRANIAACGAAALAVVHAGDALRMRTGPVADLVLLDPPYARGLATEAIKGVMAAGRAGTGSLFVAEIGGDDATPPFGDLLVERAHGAGRLVIGRCLGN